MLKKITNTYKKVASQFLTLSEREMFDNSTFGELKKMAFKESATYMKDHLEKAVLFDKDMLYWKHIFNKIPEDGFVFEFGVYKGRTVNYYAELLESVGDKRTIYGFDSFEGFSEDWGGTIIEIDHFNQDGKLPDVKSNVELVKGWVEETYPEFIKGHFKKDDTIAYMHIDVDTYTPTKCILENSLPYLGKGTIIDFDEMFGYYGWKYGEFKAFSEILENKCDYEFIAFWENSLSSDPVVKAAIKIIDI